MFRLLEVDDDLGKTWVDLKETGERLGLTGVDWGGIRDSGVGGSRKGVQHVLPDDGTGFRLEMKAASPFPSSCYRGLAGFL